MVISLAPADNDTNGGVCLALENVGMEYRDSGGAALPVFRNLGAAVSGGRMVCLAGRSGSGKTTAILVAAGLLAPTSGRVLWQGLPIENMTPDEVTRTRGAMIGIVFQDAALIPTLQASENVALAAMAGDGGRVDPERIESLLESVGLSDRARHFPAQLSGGEQQRVALARALYRDPPVLLVDEPTANLDRRSADSIVSMLDGFRRNGRALMVASHDEHLIASADTVIELE